MRLSRVATPGVCALLALWITACSAGTGTEASNSTPSNGSTFHSAPAPSLSASSSPADNSALSLVVFGDSWGYGAHCHGCTPWPKLLAADYRSSLGVDVTLTDLSENGGNSALLVDELKNKPAYRDAIASADIVAFNQGINDLDKTIDPAALTDMWTTNLDAMLDVVDELRNGQPTAVRMVGISNEYIDNAGLQGLAKSGHVIFEAFNNVSCSVAADHGGQCVDLRPILNGPDGEQPANVNTQESMNAVSAAIAATGLAELHVQ